MGRTQKNPVHNYFQYNKIDNVSKCKVEGCQVNVKGNHGTNLSKHLKTYHPNSDAYKQMVKYTESEKKSKPENVEKVDQIAVASPSTSKCSDTSLSTATKEDKSNLKYFL